MAITKIDSEFSHCQQILLDDIEDIREEGYVILINVRPDHEQAGQPTASELEAEANKHGLAYFHIPVSPGKATKEDVERFAAAMKSMEGPVLAFCKTGIRAKGLYSMTRENPDPELRKKLFGA